MRLRLAQVRFRADSREAFNKCSIVLLHMLNLIENYGMEERNGLNVHRLVEAMKFGFAAR